MKGTGRPPVLLDLFCGEGGAAAGYAAAGFEVVGVDINPQPNYPFRFLQLDALTLTGRNIPAIYDAVHASPPCQSFTDYRRKGHGVGDNYENLIPETRELLEDTGLPYVIENVEKARMELRDPVMFCGSTFGLDVRRHRLFETNWPLSSGTCDHASQIAKGKRFPGATNRNGRYTVEIGVWRIPLDVQQRAMMIDWMSLEGLSQSIPPAYTEHIGTQLMEYLRAEEA